MFNIVLFSKKVRDLGLLLRGGAYLKEYSVCACL